MFRESFANSAFNGISFLEVVATNLVNGIKVSGIRLDSSRSRLSGARRVLTSKHGITVKLQTLFPNLVNYSCMIRFYFCGYIQNMTIS